MACVVLLSLLVTPVAARATPTRVALPQRLDRAEHARRTRVIGYGRTQTFSPHDLLDAGRIARQPVTMNQAIATLAKRVHQLGLSHPTVKSSLPSLPLPVRAQLFVRLATEQGHAPASFQRRLRGKLRHNGKTTMAKPKKRFIEVTPETFALWQQVMGDNTLNFAVYQQPNHLHTLIRDQSGAQKTLHDNTYGSMFEPSRIHSHQQIVVPVQLTPDEMSRMTRYTNAGAQHGRGASGGVHGFWTSRKELVRDTACTNWATSAPVGKLPRWANTLEKRLRAANVLPPELRDVGLHGALARTVSRPQYRAPLERRVLGGLRKGSWTYKAAKRMFREFDKHQRAFPNRPADTYLRTSLAGMLGLGRSQDPSKWSYDLMLSKHTPVVFVFNPSRDPNFVNTAFDMRSMGVFDHHGVHHPPARQ